MPRRFRDQFSETQASPLHCPLLPAFCEMKTRGQWHTVPLQVAWRMNSRRLLRCTECHGRIRVHSPAGGGSPIRHVEPHSGCFFCLDFDGVPRPHPRPLT